MPNLDIDHNFFNREISKLNSLASSLGTLSPSHQKLVAEIILLRLFSLLENAIASICIKIACGANYLDGTASILLKRATSFQSAISLFRTHGRSKTRKLIWTRGREIKENVKYIIDSSDNLFNIIDIYSPIIAEIKYVRNRIAHNNEKSRENYKSVVRQHYGAYLKNITPGILLLTKRKTPNLLIQYIIKTRIFIKELTKK